MTLLQFIMPHLGRTRDNRYPFSAWHCCVGDRKGIHSLSSLQPYSSYPKGFCLSNFRKIGWLNKSRCQDIIQSFPWSQLLPRAPGIVSGGYFAIVGICTLDVCSSSSVKYSFTVLFYHHYIAFVVLLSVHRFIHRKNRLPDVFADFFCTE